MQLLSLVVSVDENLALVVNILAVFFAFDQFGPFGVVAAIVVFGANENLDAVFVAWMSDRVGLYPFGCVNGDVV